MNKLLKTFITFIFLFIFAISLNLNLFAEGTEEHSHSYDNGICECGDYQKPELFNHINGGYIVSNAGELLWYAKNYNEGNIIHNLIVKGNITIPDNISWIPMGNSSTPFKESIKTYLDEEASINFNTQTITSNNFGLVGYSEDTISIKNLTLKGTFNIDSSVSNVGAFVGLNNSNLTITSVKNYVNINLLEKGYGSSKIGGIVGSSSNYLKIDTSSNYGNLIVDGAFEKVGGITSELTQGAITNSANYGEVSSNSAKYVGGIIGHCDNAQFEGMKNVLNLGKVTGKEFPLEVNNESKVLKAGDLIGYFGNYLEDVIKNNYYIGTDAFGIATNDSIVYGISRTNDEDVTSGKLAYLLGNKFGQKIDNLLDGESPELYPTPLSEEVFEVKFCNGVDKFYSNFNQDKEHVFKYHVEDNIIYETCEACDHNKKIELKANENLHFDKTYKHVRIVSDIIGFDATTLPITYSADPIFPGDYIASISYNDLVITLEFTVLKGIPQKEMFESIPLKDELIYDSTPKNIELFKTDELGMGEIYLKYYRNEEEVANVINGGMYSVQLCVAEGLYYEAYEFSRLDVFTLIIVKQKEVSVKWTNTTLYYEDGKNIYTPEYIIEGTYNNDRPVVNFSSIASSIGTYTTSISLVSDNYVLTGDTSVTFTVKKKLVETPNIGFGVVEEGKTFTPNVTETSYYTVLKADTVSNSGRYSVILKLKDPANYTWADTDSDEITLTFFVYQLDNEWVTYPSIESWKYGDTPNKVVYEVSNSYSNFLFYYRHINGEFSTVVPTEVGEYEVKLVHEINDLRVAPLEDVVLSFSILKATPDCLINSTFTVPYKTKLGDIVLAGYGDGKWSFKEDVNKVFDAGTHVVELEFTPTDTLRYETVTKDVILVVEPLNVEYSKPTGIENLIYNANNQALIIPGSAINGTMYYKVNDGEWSINLPIAKDAGTYTVYYKVEPDPNYVGIDENNIEVKIEKANLTIIPVNFEVEQYKEVPTLTYKTDGIFVQDSLTKEPELSVSINDTKLAGTYTINATGAENPNYNITYLTGTLTVFEHTVCTGGTPTCTSKALCEVCNKEYGEMLDHVYNNYLYNNDATTSKDGTISSKCAHCDSVDTKTLENTKLPETIVNNNETTNENNSDNKSSKLGLGIVIGSLSMLVITGCVYFFVIKKKK